jgi:hypothetical protein
VVSTFGARAMARIIVRSEPFSGPLCARGLETAKGCHKVVDFAGRRGFAGFEVALNA